MCRWTALLLAAGSLFAQEKIVSTRIYSEPPGAAFTVDGQLYVGDATFLWPERSRHIIAIPAVPPPSETTRYVFREWQDPNGQRLLAGSTAAITADSVVSSYKAVFDMFYSLELGLNNTGTAPFACVAGTQYGKVYLDDACYASSQFLWILANKMVNVQVYTPDGFAFLGWAGTLNGAQSPILQFAMAGPMLLYPRFGPATQVTFATSPAELQVIADRQTVRTPISYSWAEGSQHTIGVETPQRDYTGSLWAFDSWSDGGAQHHGYTTGGANAPVTFTARFLPAIPVGVVTSPLGLKLVVDGQSTSQSSFAWGIGSKHTISAPAETTDANGRHYRFRSWTNSGDATQEVTVTAENNGWLANYDPLNSVTLRTDPATVTLQVDGASCPSPCTVHRAAGTEVRISAPASVALQESARIDFDNWSDGGPLSHTVKADADSKTLQATYQYFYRIATSSDPAGGADFRFEPASTDAFFASGTLVGVIATARPGYRFRLWQGDLTGGLPSGSLKVTGPRSVRAVLDKVPYVAPSGVRNGAAVTPEDGLAPGSIIAIYGSSLAGSQVAGPHSPLAQTLGAVTVRLADRLLGLYFVSPEQINAQLPSDLADGDYTLKVRWEGHEDVSASFKVVRNAPGLFTQPADGVAYALAVRADGSLITPKAPANPGETVTLYGTGFGRYLGLAPNGFAVPASANLALADPVEVRIGDQTITPAFAGAAEGEVGVVIVRFTVPGTATQPVELRVTANGKESNTVVLPIQKKMADSETGPV